MTKNRKNLKILLLDRSKSIVFILFFLLVLMVAKVYITVQKNVSLIDDAFTFEIVLFCCLLMELIIRKKTKNKILRSYSYAKELSAKIFLFGFIALAVIDFSLYMIKGNSFINIYLIFMLLIFVGSVIDWIIKISR